MEPYPIRATDYVLKIAHKFDFDADTTWTDPANKELADRRGDPNILLAGDVLYIPDQVDKVAESHSLVVGTTNTFVSPNPPLVAISVKFVGAGTTTYAQKAYTIRELDSPDAPQTTKDGLANFKAPVTLEIATIVFTDSGEEHSLAIGALNPVDTPSGIFQRLKNIGFIGNIDYDSDAVDNNLEIVRAALVQLKTCNEGSLWSEFADASASADTDPDPAASSSWDPSALAIADPADASWSSPDPSASSSADPDPAASPSPDPSASSSADPDPTASSSGRTSQAEDPSGLSKDWKLATNARSMLKDSCGC